jgi:hypothetical protein
MRSHRMWASWIACITLLIASAPSGFHGASAQMENAQKDTKYFTSFLNKPPSKEDMSRLPSDAKDVVVAKVRVVASYGFGGRHGEALGPRPRNALFGVEVIVTAVVSGNATMEPRQNTIMGPRHHVVYGRPGSGLRHIIPHTQGQRALEYYIVSYRRDDQWRRLVEFPITKEKFEEWEKEALDRERVRGRPSARD